MAGENLRVLVSCISALGHVNAAIGLADLLKARGHHIIFAQKACFRGLVQGHDFEFLELDEQAFDQKAVSYGEVVEGLGHLFRRDPVTRFTEATKEELDAFNSIFDENFSWERAFEKVLATYDDYDVVIVDHFQPSPPLLRLTKPCGFIFSANPISLYKDKIPFGFGLTKEDIGTPRHEEATSILKTSFEAVINRKKRQLEESGFKDLADKYSSDTFIYEPNSSGSSNEFGIYHYPEDLDYLELGTISKNWIRIDSFVRKAVSNFEVPEKLINKPGKLVYFSLGSLASIDLKVMNKLLKALSNSPHRFIVSTGPLGDDVKLYDNMWGEKYLDQVAVLEKVDFAILHGGNNGFMEALHCGKPMIVVPYFFDQIDNAKRAEDKGIGKQILIWDYDEEKFLAAIEEVANNEEMKEKVEKISQNMRNSRSGDNAVKIIEKMVIAFENNNR